MACNSLNAGNATSCKVMCKKNCSCSTVSYYLVIEVRPALHVKSGSCVRKATRSMTSFLVRKGVPLIAT
jgi:hypothetical protein